MPVPTSQTGAAGEFYVVAQLSQRGWDASVLSGNAPRTDILAQHAETGTTISVQSKAANGGGIFRSGSRERSRASQDSRSGVKGRPTSGLGQRAAPHPAPAIPFAMNSLPSSVSFVQSESSS